VTSYTGMVWYLGRQSPMLADGKFFPTRTGKERDKSTLTAPSTLLCFQKSPFNLLISRVENVATVAQVQTVATLKRSLKRCFFKMTFLFVFYFRMHVFPSQRKTHVGGSTNLDRKRRGENVRRHLPENFFGSTGKKDKIQNTT